MLYFVYNGLIIDLREVIVLENVLTIAGSDSLAGGGIQADLKTFEEMNVFGVSALTSIASILPTDVAVTPLPADLLDQQLTSILTQLPLRAAKTGLLGSVAAIEVVSQQLRKHPVPLVIDPVLVLKEGALTPQAEYLATLKQRLLPLGTVTTPNLAEAQQLSGLTLTKAEQLPAAAQRIQALGCPNVVIKGGSRLAGSTAVDYLRVGDQDYWFSTPKLKQTTTDGAGCTFSAAITAQLALGKPLPDAVAVAKRFVRLAIRHGVTISDQFGSVWQGASRQWEDHHGKE